MAFGDIPEVPVDTLFDSRRAVYDAPAAFECRFVENAERAPLPRLRVTGRPRRRSAGSPRRCRGSSPTTRPPATLASRC